MSELQFSRLNISQSKAEHAEGVYDRFLERVKQLSATNDIKVISDNIANLIDSIIEKLSSKDEPLLLYTSKVFDRDYIFAHSLNVCLISVRIGIRRKLDSKRLKILGFLALTHAGEDTNFPKDLVKVGEGGKQLDEIVRLADVYDALTHPPRYRHAVTPYETLTSIINTDKFFPHDLIKILLEEVSLYPKGSWVQLSTRQIGQVVKINKEMLLRPTVEIFTDCEGEPLTETNIVNLSQNNLIYILRPVANEEIEYLTSKE